MEKHGLYSRNGGILDRKFLHYFLPTLITTIAISLNEFVDSLVVSNLLGSDALSIVNLGSPIVLAMAAVYTLFGNGGATVYGVLCGKQDRKSAGQVFRLSMFVSMAVGILFLVLGMAFLSPLCNMLCRTGELIGDYLDFCRASWGKVHDSYILDDPECYDEWRHTRIRDYRRAEQGIGLPPGIVPSVTFWIFQDRRMTGIVNFRPVLNDRLQHYGGHLGFAIRPEYRGRADRRDPEALTMITLSTDKPSYQVGEKATVYIPAAQGGKALVMEEICKPRMDLEPELRAQQLRHAAAASCGEACESVRVQHGMRHEHAEEAERHHGVEQIGVEVVSRLKEQPHRHGGGEEAIY